MLPSSHAALINDHPLDAHAGEAIAEDTPPPTSAALLADAFSEFIATSSRLEISYRELQAEVYGLGRELAERNAELNTSLAQNEAMRLALQQIVDSMPCGVMVVNGDGGISTINPETDRVLGFEVEEAATATTLQEIARRTGLNLDLIFSADSGSDTEQECAIQTSAGTRWLEIRNRRLFHQPGTSAKPDQTILILRDITAQKRAEQDREAGRNAMALAEVTTILAHEIRNPLASLELFAELIEQDETRRAEWISNLRAGVRSLSGTVNNVLSFHSAASSKLVPLPLAAIVTTAIAFMHPLADQAGVTFDWPGRNCDLLVSGNDGALRQVLLNLFANAIRHTPVGGSVTVSLRKGRNGHAILTCSDTGCGIRPDQIARVFEPGFSGFGDSTGLGLAVCARIIAQHGGSISAANNAGSGACFCIEFPALNLEMIAA